MIEAFEIFYFYVCGSEHLLLRRRHIYPSGSKLNQKPQLRNKITLALGSTDNVSFSSSMLANSLECLI